MIQINLLPEERRPAERTPLPRFLLMAGGVAGFSVAALALVYLLFEYRRQEDRRRDVSVSISREQRAIDEINRLNGEIRTFRARKAKIEDLRKNRRLWAPILHMLCDGDVLPQNLWFRNMEMKEGKRAASGLAAPYELAISGYARGLKKDDATLFVATTQSTRDFARNVVSAELYAAEFEGRPDWSAEPIQLTDLRASGDKSPPDAPKRALSFTMKLMLKTKGLVPGAQR